MTTVKIAGSRLLPLADKAPLHAYALVKDTFGEGSTLVSSIAMPRLYVALPSMVRTRYTFR